MSTGSPLQSALYVGSVMHRRLVPRRHKLRYRVFWTLIDLDEPEVLAGRLKLFSHNRFNLVSFHDADHGAGGTVPLRTYVEQALRRHGIAAQCGRITLLCMPRVLGYVFNPLSIYFCHDEVDRLIAVLYEVRNTFGQRHSYLMPVTEETGTIRHGCNKAFYVSPFLDMDLAYDFRIMAPSATVSAVITASNPQGPTIIAVMAGTRRAMSDSALLGLLLTHPLLTLKVIGAIHWEALKIWMKGIRLRPRPPAPAEPISYIPLEDSEARR